MCKKKCTRDKLTAINSHGTPVKIFVFKARVYQLSVSFVLLIIVSDHSFVISLVAGESDFIIKFA